MSDAGYFDSAGIPNWLQFKPGGMPLGRGNPGIADAFVSSATCLSVNFFRYSGYIVSIRNLPKPRLTHCPAEPRPQTGGIVGSELYIRPYQSFGKVECVQRTVCRPAL